jgi:hypothetical protein
MAVEHRTRRWWRFGSVVAAGGAAALLLAACGPGVGAFSVDHPTSIPAGSSHGQTVGTLVLNWRTATRYFSGRATTSLYLDVSDSTPSGTVTLTRAADTGIGLTVSGTGTFGGACTVETASTLVCTSLTDLNGGSVTYVLKGLKVNSTNGSGGVAVRATVPGTTATPALTQTVLAATFVVGQAEPVFVTHPSAGGGSDTKAGTLGDAVTFHAGSLGSTWIAVHGATFYLSLVGAPSWLHIGTHTGYLYGSVPKAATGTYTFTVVANTTPHPTQRHSPNLQAREKVTLHVVP